MKIGDIAQIPYIVHELRMYKLYCKKQRCLKWLIGTNIIWAAVVVWLLVR